MCFFCGSTCAVFRIGGGIWSEGLASALWPAGLAPRGGGTPSVGNRPEIPLVADGEDTSLALQHIHALFLCVGVCLRRVLEGSDRAVELFTPLGTLRYPLVQLSPPPGKSPEAPHVPSDSVSFPHCPVNSSLSCAICRSAALRRFSSAARNFLNSRSRSLARLSASARLFLNSRSISLERFSASAPTSKRFFQTGAQLPAWTCSAHESNVHFQRREL